MADFDDARKRLVEELGKAGRDGLNKEVLLDLRKRFADAEAEFGTITRQR